MNSLENTYLGIKRSFQKRRIGKKEKVWHLQSLNFTRSKLKKLSILTRSIKVCINMVRMEL
jgi:hypothetical protein